MRTRKLGPLEVGVVGLGCNNFGRRVDADGTRAVVDAAIDASLARLQTDYVDLYQHHEEDPDTPLEETISVLEDLVAAGKIRAYGTSNYAPETLEQAATVARGGYVSEQSEFSWLVRAAERELLPACE